MREDGESLNLSKLLCNYVARRKERGHKQRERRGERNRTVIHRNEEVGLIHRMGYIIGDERRIE